MFASPYRTSVTQQHAMEGKNMRDCQPSNVRRGGPGTGFGKSAAPRTREGKSYPGGRPLRRAFKRLHTRRDGDSGHGNLPDRLNRGQQKQGNYYVPSMTLPGSMKA